MGRAGLGGECFRGAGFVEPLRVRWFGGFGVGRSECRVWDVGWRVKGVRCSVSVEDSGFRV